MEPAFWAGLPFFFFYTGAVAWLSLASEPPTVRVAWLSWDKIQHAGAYFFLTFLSGRAFIDLMVSRQWAWRMALLFSVSFGILMETAQLCLTTARTADMYDVAANIVGAAAVYLLACFVPRVSGKPLRVDNPPTGSSTGGTEVP